MNDVNGEFRQFDAIHEAAYGIMERSPLVVWVEPISRCGEARALLRAPPRPLRRLLHQRRTWWSNEWFAAGSDAAGLSDAIKSRGLFLAWLDRASSIGCSLHLAFNQPPTRFEPSQAAGHDKPRLK
jgi:hypothetical protein